MDGSQRTLLITLTGRDRPGVTSRLFATLAEFPVTVTDVEQVVIRGRLILGVLLSYARGTDIGKVWTAAEKVATDLDMEVEVSTARDRDAPRRRGRLHVTVLGNPLRPAAMAGIAGRIAAAGANIDRIERLARYPVTCIEMDVSGADPEALRGALAAEAAAQQVDVAVQPSGLHRRAKRLIVMDVDSTLIQGEVIELLAEQAGCLDEVAKVTEAAMRGELDFEGSLRERVALLAGLDASCLEEVRRKIRLAAGARTMVRTLKRLDYKFAIVSGGFTQITDSLVEELGIDYSAANTLEICDGKLTGRLVGPIIDRAGKARALEDFARRAGVPISQTVAIGDGANDLDMLQAAGLGVAYNAKPVVRQAADTAVNVPYLDTILFLLGISRDEIEAADAEDQEPFLQY
ncbi:phosphoserine phosphatase SerB [Thermomonospora curvata]|uniref:phosphoserine phosphatase n=1 Tax=Thermomonospora curvata (strain ATCC 19995 / DSM 43183 / JCM 3096 / KCTC 9072 / NBRC 15933 / NCIMB 10081 / Henssen B9) TaxID=471852 RepID=D1A7D2_THECD|nr:phosphoserine phosphatase SerB [Thermomonospora curvata]ACZ00338.1 phosphoserine phosphatase SerB [Thermomonospora curvata DSM 43183]